MGSEVVAVAVELDPVARELLDGKNFATLATVGPAGEPRSSVVWVARDGDTLLFSSTAHRQKVRNLARDARVSVSVFDLADPYRSVEIRGTAELVEDPGKALPVRLSHKYLGIDPPHESDDEVRVIIRVTPEKVVTFSA